MFTTMIVIVIFLTLVGYAMIFVSESKQLRDNATHKVSLIGGIGEFLGGALLFAVGIFVGASLLHETPRNAMRAMSHPEILTEGNSANVPPPDAPNVSLFTWDTATRQITCPDPEEGHFWIISYATAGGIAREPVPVAGLKKIPDGVTGVEIYTQRKSPAAASPPVSFATN
jgi:hypothetical protein